MTIGCGLPSYTVVEAPVVSSNGTTYVSFEAPSDSNIDGYEIYYKIYTDDDDEIEDDEDEFDIDSSSYVYEFGDTLPDSLNFNRLMRLESSSSTSSDSIPFITAGTASDELDSGEECIIYLLDSSTTDYITLGGTTFAQPLRIAIDDDDSDYKNFSDDTVESEDDDSNGVDSDDITPYSVSFVAYSYVNNAILVDYESSYPVFLGTITDLSN
jgi:hypothetical protein